MALVSYKSEYGRLKKVALYRPALHEIDQGPASKAMYIQTPDPQTVLREFDGIVSALQGLDIEVTVLQPQPDMVATTNMIYLRDVAFTFRDKLVLANMKHTLRKEEPAKFRELLIANQTKYANSFVELEAHATMEGADIFALTKDSLCIYTGSRTSVDAPSLLEDIFAGVRTQTIQAGIRDVPQHILGGMHILDKDLACRRTAYCQDTIEGYRYIDFEENEEIKHGFALNIVTISPREILMPEGNPLTKAALESSGVHCHEVLVNEIHKMGGGLACMTLPLWRD